MGVRTVNIQEAITQLEAQWNFVDNTGFFGKLRMGVYSQEDFDEVIEVLNTLPSSDSEIQSGSTTMNRRIVELTWFMPTFMRWQQSRWPESDETYEKLTTAIDLIEGRLTTILGLP